MTSEVNDIRTETVIFQFLPAHQQLSNHINYARLALNARLLLQKTNYQEAPTMVTSLKHLLLAMLFLSLSGVCSAQVIVYKHDQFDDNIVTASGQIASIPLGVQPGFAQNEAFGQVYTPGDSDYPVKILGVDMVMAAPPNGNVDSTANAWIEIWQFDGAGPSPSDNSPLWSVHTSELYNSASGQTGVPLTGGTAWSVDFDWDTEGNHPPLINSGKFALVIRFDDPSSDLQTEWSTIQCAYLPNLGACGCQKVAPIVDQAAGNHVNLIEIIGMGQCSGDAATWMWADDAGIGGDFILRARAEGTQCNPDCAGKCCGDDGCGGQCPDQCGDGFSCNANTCQCEQASTCTENDVRCSGDIVQRCISGQWVAQEDCSQSGFTCKDGVCEGCTAQCDGKDCGPDGCGGLCGQCQDGEICQDGTCVTQGDTLSITAISPDFGYDDVDTAVSITGQGFVDPVAVKLGGTNLVSTQVTSSQLIEATVPSGMEPGTYMLIVINPDSSTASLQEAFEVRHREQDGGSDGGIEDGSTDGGQDGGSTETEQDESPASGCGCSSSNHHGFHWGLLLLALMTSAAVRRRPS